MNNLCEFSIIGRIGDIRKVGSTLHVSIASTSSRRDDAGEWVDYTRWNEITVFSDEKKGYVKRNLAKGDLVFARGAPSQTQWEKDGETVYGVTLACESIERLTKGSNRAHAPGPQDGKDSPPPPTDDDIPF